jgi:hypothetical protein
LRLTRGTQDILKQCGYYVLDDSEIFVFSHNGEEKQVRNKCTDAEESYARQALGWPKGRLAKPSIFRESTTRPGDIQACVTQFVHHIGQLLEHKTHEGPKQLEVYPFAFVVFDYDDPSGQVTVVVALKGKDDQWSLDSCRIPLEVRLGQELDGLRMGDISTQDLVSSYGLSTPPATAQQSRSSSSQPSSQDHWSFAIFSTGLPNALSLPAWIAACVDCCLRGLMPALIPCIQPRPQ